MSEMVDRVANALFESLKGDGAHDAWIDHVPASLSELVVDGHVDLVKLAHAAIAALENSRA